MEYKIKEQQINIIIEEIRDTVIHRAGSKIIGMLQDFLIPIKPLDSNLKKIEQNDKNKK